MRAGIHDTSPHNLLCVQPSSPLFHLNLDLKLLYDGSCLRAPRPTTAGFSIRRASTARASSQASHLLSRSLSSLRHRKRTTAQHSTCSRTSPTDTEIHNAAHCRENGARHDAGQEVPGPRQYVRTARSAKHTSMVKRKTDGLTIGNSEADVAILHCRYDLSSFRMRER